MPEPAPPNDPPAADSAAAARLHRLGLVARLIMAFNTLVVMAILGFCLWKVGQLIGAW